eukprot:7194688-Alexandrium_andersonii.AAC.1
MCPTLMYLPPLLRHLQPGATIWMAPECSSWGFLCRFQSKRSRGHPFGDVSREWVARGNNQILR